MITDAFVRSVLSPVLLLLLLTFLVPVGVSVWVLLRTGFLTGAESADTILLVNWLVEFSGIPGESAGVIVGSMPILIAALVYRPGTDRTLNWIGRAALVLTLLGAVVSGLVTAYVDPHSARQQNALTGGGPSLKAMQEAGTVGLRLMLNYLFLLIGINLPIQRPGGGN